MDLFSKNRSCWTEISDPRLSLLIVHRVNGMFSLLSSSLISLFYPLKKTFQYLSNKRLRLFPSVNHLLRRQWNQDTFPVSNGNLPPTRSHRIIETCYWFGHVSNVKAIPGFTSMISLDRGAMDVPFSLSCIDTSRWETWMNFDLASLSQSPSNQHQRCLS